MNIIYRAKNRIYRALRKKKEKNFLNQLHSFGKNVSIKQPVCFEGINNIQIGEDVSIAAFVHIWGQGNVVIGNRVMIASHVAITTITHDYNKKAMFNTVISNPVVIEDDVWIGSHAVIMPGITVGKGAVIGSGAVVTKDVLPYQIVTGIPAKVVKTRIINED